MSNLAERFDKITILTHSHQQEASGSFDFLKTSSKLMNIQIGDDISSNKQPDTFSERQISQI